MGITINRLDQKELNKDMRQILISKHRYMLNREKTKAVIHGDPDGFQLLVGKGGEIDPVVAEAYGLEVEDSMEVSKVTQTEDEAYHNLVTAGSGSNSQKTFSRLEAQKRITDKINRASPAPVASGTAAIQRAHLTEGLVNNEMGAQAAYTDAPVNSPRFDEMSADDKAEKKDASKLEPDTLPPNKRTKTVGTENLQKELNLTGEEDKKETGETGQGEDLTKNPPPPPENLTPPNNPPQDPEKDKTLDPDKDKQINS